MRVADSGLPQHTCTSTLWRTIGSTSAARALLTSDAIPLVRESKHLTKSLSNHPVCAWDLSMITAIPGSVVRGLKLTLYSRWRRRAPCTTACRRHTRCEGTTATGNYAMCVNKTVPYHSCLKGARTSPDSLESKHAHDSTIRGAARRRIPAG